MLPSTQADSPRIVFAMINSNITAIAAELVADFLQGAEVQAICRRGCQTRLAKAGDGEQLERRYAPRSLKDCRKRIREFDAHFSRLSDGEPFDVLVYHNSDPLSQMLVTHPLCRKYFYIEEGLTASAGKRLGRKRKRGVTYRRFFWRIKSRLFYGGRVLKYTHTFYNIGAKNYGGVYALSLTAFPNFPGRIQLPFQNLPPIGEDPDSDLVILLDSQYFIGGCTYEEYLNALIASIEKVLKSNSSVAIKFHPGEKDSARKERIKAAITGLPQVISLKELPPEFIAERMPGRDSTSVIVGTSALGLYMGNRGFPTYTFARRLYHCSPKIVEFIDDIPNVFFDVCKDV